MTRLLVINELQMQKEIMAYPYMSGELRSHEQTPSKCVKSQTNGATRIFFWGGGGAADLAAIKNFI